MDSLNFLFGLSAMKPIHENMKSNDRIDDAIVFENSVKAVNLIDSNDLTVLLEYSQADTTVYSKELCLH